ncbi:MAG: tripartite tricarboxylate transporter permease [Candidatus Methanofastidiosia archaeon]|jgi:putative membrane protein
MILLYIGGCILGCSLGVVTGLTPGIHVNTLLPFLVFVPGSGELGACIIFSLAVTHTVLDFIPSTLFGVPDADTALSVLPAHTLLLAGRGYEAIKLTIMGSLGALVVSCVLAVPLMYVIPVVYQIVYPYLKYVLLVLIIFIIGSETSLKKIGYAAFIFVISGVYGYIVLSGHVIPENVVLFPVFCGLFGMSTLLYSLKGQNQIPLQPIDSRVHLQTLHIFLNIVKGTLAGVMVSLFPGIGPAHATAVLSIRSSPRQFLVAVSGVNTANAVCALIGLYAFGKARSGAVVAIQDITNITQWCVILLLSCSLIAAGIASVAALYIARSILRVLSHLPYRNVTVFIFVVLLVTSYVITGLTGWLVMGIGCCIGLLPILLGVRRSHCMGVLLFPILIYYFGFS